MRLTLHFLILSYCLLYLSSCATRTLTKSYDSVSTKKIYSLSVGDAAKPQEWEVFNDLISIKSDNQQLVWKTIKGEQYLLVASWKADTSYYKNDPKTGFYNTGKYPIWVSAAPQLQQLCQSSKFGLKEGVDLRLKQLLGMPPDVDKQYFVEFWVRPQDLFRPCPDPEITDKSCGLAFPKDTEEAHISWINNQRLASYYNPIWNQNYPWTELGYTYDWNPKNKTHIGVSEFIIANNANIVIKGFQTTAQYCNCTE